MSLLLCHLICSLHLQSHHWSPVCMLVSLELAPSVPHVAIGLASTSVRLHSHYTAYQNHFMALAITVPVHASY